MLSQNQSVEFNNKGYLVDFNAWSKEMAMKLAKEANLELTECHWLVINYLRKFYEEYETAPPPRVIIQKIGKQVSNTESCTKKHLESLFPEGGCKFACKLAGLPAAYCHSC